MMVKVSGTNVHMKMVSWTHKCLRGNGLIDHLTGVEKITDDKSLTNPSHTANSHSFVDCVTKNRLFRKKKEKTYCHDSDKKSCRNNIICGSFYQRYSLILPSPSKLRHDFPQVISIKKVASLLYPSLSFKVSCLVLSFDSYLFKKKKTDMGSTL